MFKLKYLKEQIFILVFLSIFLTVPPADAGVFTDMLNRLRTYVKLDSNLEPGPVDGEDFEIKPVRKNASFLFELPDSDFEIGDGITMPSSFRENILTRDLYLLKFLDDFELFKFIIYIPTTRIKMLDRLINGELDPRLEITMTPYHDLTQEHFDCFRELASELGLKTDNPTPNKVTDVLCIYHLNLVKDHIEDPESEEWKEVVNKQKDFTKTELDKIVSFEISIINQYKKLLTDIQKSNSTAVISKSVYSIDPNLFLSDSPQPDSVTVTITDELESGREINNGTTGYYVGDDVITQDLIPVLAGAGYTYIFQNRQVLRDSLMDIEYPDSTQEEFEAMSDYLFYTVKDNDILELLFYTAEFDRIFSKENLDNFQDNADKLYDSIPDPEQDSAGLFENKEPLTVILISAETLSEYKSGDFEKLEKIFNYFLDAGFFNFIELNSYLKRNNKKHKLFLLRRLNANLYSDPYDRFRKQRSREISSLNQMNSVLFNLKQPLQDYEKEDKPDLELKYNRMIEDMLILKGIVSQPEEVENDVFFNIASYEFSKKLAALAKDLQIQ